MVEWFPVIAVGVALLGFMIGGMMNVIRMLGNDSREIGYKDVRIHPVMVSCLVW